MKCHNFDIIGHVSIITIIEMSWNLMGYTLAKHDFIIPCNASDGSHGPALNSVYLYFESNKHVIRYDNT